MAKRLKIATHHLSTDSVVIGGSVVLFTRSGRDWVSEPVSDKVASAVAGHPQFEEFESDEPVIETEVDPLLVDFSNSREVERLLLSIPIDALGETVREFEGITDCLVRALDDDTLRDVVRQEVDAADLVGYLPDPVGTIRNFVVANAGRLAARREAFLASISQAELRAEYEAAARASSAGAHKVLIGGVTPDGQLDTNGAAVNGETLTAEQIAIIDRLGLSVPSADAKAEADKPEKSDDLLGDVIDTALKAKGKGRAKKADAKAEADKPEKSDDEVF